MREIASYIVRVYRRGGRSISGVVEDVQTGCVHSFHSVLDLWRTLDSASAPVSQPKEEERHETEPPGPAGRGRRRRGL